MSEFIDISEYVTDIDYGTRPDITGFVVPGLRDSGPIVITGTWKSSDTIADFVVRCAIAGPRAPRKSKKAFRKLWMGARLTTKERQRISHLRLTI